MAVYTELAAQELHAVVEGYGLGSLQAAEPIPAGIENTNYWLTTSRGRFVLTLFERAEAPAVAAELALLDALAGAGVLCPRPIGRAGGWLSTLHGRPAAVFPCLPGGHREAPGEAELEALGVTLAGLHRAGAELSAPAAGPHLGGELHRLAEGLALRLEGSDGELAELLRGEAAYQLSVPQQSLPGGLIHGDPFLDNFLFQEGSVEVSAILDFGMAGRGPWLYDVAVLLLDVAWVGEGLSGDRARAVLRGYRGTRPLTGPEHTLLGDYLRRAALRFLCLRVQRFVLDPRPMHRGAGKDPRELAGRLRCLRQAL